MEMIGTQIILIERMSTDKCGLRFGFVFEACHSETPPNFLLGKKKNMTLKWDDLQKYVFAKMLYL